MASRALGLLPIALELLLIEGHEEYEGKHQIAFFVFFAPLGVLRVTRFSS
jgi:hypothetical protein